MLASARASAFFVVMGTPAARFAALVWMRSRRWSPPCGRGVKQSSVDKGECETSEDRGVPAPPCVTDGADAEKRQLCSIVD